MTVNQTACYVDHAMARIHEAVTDGRDLVGMTAAASLSCIIKKSRKAGHTRVRFGLRSALIIAAMAESAIVGGEAMRC